MNALRRLPYYVPGALLCLGIAFGSRQLMEIPALQHLGLGSLTLAILIGCWPATSAWPASAASAPASTCRASSCCAWAWCSMACA